MTSRFTTRFKQFATGVLMAAIGAGAYGIAGVPFSDFQPGMKISAQEMNDKLNALKAAVDANRASVICPARRNPNDPRFTDNGDGTICDADTGLMWEKKTGEIPSQGTFGVLCNTITDCPDPHNVNNKYTWTDGDANGDPQFYGLGGTLFTDFLARINRGRSRVVVPSQQLDPSGSFTFIEAGYTDWRIPNIVELLSIVRYAGPGRVDCHSTGCIDPIFGPAYRSGYWSSSVDLDVCSNNGKGAGSLIVDFSPIRISFFHYSVCGRPSGTAYPNNGAPQFARAVRGPRILTR